MHKKMILSAFVLLFVNAAEAKNVWPSKAIVLNCTPATKSYPFESFELTLDRSVSTMKVKFSEQSGSAYPDSELKTGRNGDYLKVESISVEEHDGEILMFDAKVYGDFHDWGAVQIEIGQDDNGSAAFIYFYSDGPSIRSFYRCETK